LSFPDETGERSSVWAAIKNYRACQIEVRVLTHLQVQQHRNGLN
jgi:hypothetical protein